MDSRFRRIYEYEAESTGMAIFLGLAKGTIAYHAKLIREENRLAGFSFGWEDPEVVPVVLAPLAPSPAEARLARCPDLEPRLVRHLRNTCTQARRVPIFIALPPARPERGLGPNRHSSSRPKGGLGLGLSLARG